MTQNLYSKLCSDAVKHIDMIIDPVEKVKAIASILPFIDKTVSTEVADDKEAIRTAVQAQVAKEMQKLEAEQNEVEVKPEAPEPVKAEESKSDEIVLKDNETPEETQKRLALVVKKFGTMTLQDIYGSEDYKYVEKEFGAISEFKKKMAQFFKDNNLDVDPDAMLNYYMSLVDEENEELYNNPLIMTVKDFIEKFYPFVMSLSVIYSFDNQTITKVFNTMSSGRYKEGLNDLNINNAGALAAALTDESK